MDCRRSATFALTAAVLLMFGPGPAAASEEAAVMGSVLEFVDGINKGDIHLMSAACASPASIIDDFPPHEWHGPTACADWATAFEANNKKDGITGGIVTLGSARHVAVTGDRAYVVAHATFTYEQNGKRMKEAGATLTGALKKTAAGWRITGWAWSDPI